MAVQNPVTESDGTLAPAVVGEVVEAEVPLTRFEQRHLTMLEKRIERGLSTFREVGEALLEIRDKRLFRLSSPSFDAYCRQRWDLDRNRAYQLMSAAEVVKVLPANVTLNEAQVRELVPVYHADPSRVEKVWKEVVDQGKPVTAAIVRQVVNRQTDIEAIGKREPRTPNEAPAGDTRLYNDVITVVNKATALYAKWKKSKPPKYERDAVRKAVDEFTAVVLAQ